MYELKKKLKGIYE